MGPGEMKVIMVQERVNSASSKSLTIDPVGKDGLRYNYGTAGPVKHLNNQ